MKHTLRLLLTAGAIGFFLHTDAAETNQSDYLRDPLPQTWQLEREFSQTIPTDDKWWRDFEDPTLDSLISMSVRNNFNVSAAAHRIEMARQVWKQAHSAYFPTISANAGWQKGQSAGAISSPAGPSVGSDYFTLGLGMNWEIDVFGRVRAESKAGKASYNASVADYEAVLVALCADVARSYISLRVYQAQLKLAEEHIARQERILKIAEARFECGLASMLDVAQARTVLFSTLSTLPGLKNLIRTSVNSIALLAGVYPDRLELLFRPSGLPSEFNIRAFGIPADLLRRRPDIVEAEMNLARYAALIGVAKKDFLPTLSLSGSIGTDAHKLNNLFGSHSLSYSVAPKLSWTVFDGLARNYRLAEAKQQMMAAIDQYNLTVMTAVEETDNAMGTYLSALEKGKYLTQVVEAGSLALDKALDRYKQGLTDFISVADAQMTLLEYENSRISNKGNALSALVSIYEALGGGWSGDKLSK